MNEYDPIHTIKGIGPKKELIFQEQLGIRTIHDLLNYYPSTYKTREDVSDVASAQAGDRILTKGLYLGGSYTTYIRRNLNITTLPFRSGQTLFQIRYFNQPFRKNNFIQNEIYLLYGAVTTENGVIVLSSPDAEKYSQGASRRLKPGPYAVYPLPTKSGIRRKELLQYIADAVSHTDFEKGPPVWLKQCADLPDKKDAYRMIHLPSSSEDCLQGKHYIDFFRFLRFHLQTNAYANRTKQPGIYCVVSGFEEYIQALPFALTESQVHALEIIASDLSSGMCMNRLLQGDVGTGKTAVAICSLCVVAENGYQSVFTAPTELLAKQHYQKYRIFLERFGYQSAFLHASMKKSERTQVLEKIKNGSVHVVFGTHAVFSDDVEYHSLALAVIDEQHRFGVSQRAKLSRKGSSPHLLVMSATPIPRTLALSFYKGLDITLLRDYPVGRKQIKTVIRSSADTDNIRRFVFDECKKGHKTYIVCPAIDAENFDNVQSIYEEEKERYIPYHVGFVTGKMSEEEKTTCMQKFHDGSIMVLIATTVIEVGIDVADATVMWIKNSERYGLAQLHQLRGRVGRSSLQSYCILQNDTENEQALKRLTVLEHTSDGMKIAQADLKFRGFGELFGLRQSGKTDTLLYDALSNESLFLLTEQIAQKLTISLQREDQLFLQNLSIGKQDNDVIMN